jgi:hypothetical protein
VQVLEQERQSARRRDGRQRRRDFLAQLEAGRLLGPQVLGGGGGQRLGDLRQVSTDPPPWPWGGRAGIIHRESASGSEAVGGRVLQGPLGQSALADPRLARDKDEATGPGPGRAPGQVERGERSCPAEQGDHPLSMG